MTKEYAQKIFQLLKKHYPKAKMILEWGNNFELLVAIILSAQCTDKKVNEVTSKLFPKYRQRRRELEEKYKHYSEVILSERSEPKDLKHGSPVLPGMTKSQFESHYNEFSRIVKQSKRFNVIPAKAGIQIPGQARDDKLDKEILVQLVNFANVGLQELEQDIKSTGFYHNKAKSVKAAAQTVLEKFHGTLPRSIQELITIPGVGRKTANVFLGNAYGIYEGIAVDTHVTKQSLALGLTKNTTPEKIEQDLMQLFPKDQWFALTYMLIEHGRNKRRKASDRYVCNDSKCTLCHLE